MEFARWKDRTKFRNKFINPFLELDIIGMTIPERPKSSKQKYQITKKGIAFLQLLDKK